MKLQSKRSLLKNMLTFLQKLKNFLVIICRNASEKKSDKEEWVSERIKYITLAVESKILFPTSRLSVHPSVRAYVRTYVHTCVRRLAPIPAGESQDVTNKSCSICLMGDKNALRPARRASEAPAQRVLSSKFRKTNFIKKIFNFNHSLGLLSKNVPHFWRFCLKPPYRGKYFSNILEILPPQW